MAILEERMSELLPPIIYQLGLGALGGFIVGFAVKKALKFLVGLATIFFLILVYLELIFYDRQGF